MTWGERAFVAVSALVVLVMVGTASLIVGIIVALFTGGAMWFLLTSLAGPEEYQRRR